MVTYYTDINGKNVKVNFGCNYNKCKNVNMCYKCSSARIEIKVSDFVENIDDIKDFVKDIIEK